MYTDSSHRQTPVTQVYSYQSFGRGRATARGVRVRGGGRGGHRRGRKRTVISDEIRVILVDHLVNEIILQ